MIHGLRPRRRDTAPTPDAPTDRQAHLLDLGALLRPLQDRRTGQKGNDGVNVYVSQPAVGFWPAANLTEMGNSKWSPLR